MSEIKIFKYQFSTKRGDDILVVSGDDAEELALDIESAISKVFGEKVAPKDADESINQDPTDESFCPIHEVQMEGREGKYGFFYSHYKEVDGERVYCNGKGYKN